MKITNISMDWDDRGAVVSFTSTLPLDINCPRCGAAVKPGIEHRCGDKAKPAPKKRRAITGGAR